MAKKPIPPNLDSILNSPENINMNEAVRAQIEAAQAQIDKETKEAKQAAKEAKQAAKEIAQQLKKAKKESKQTEKKVPEEEKDSFKDKILKLDIEEFNRVFPLLEKIMASKNNKIGNNIASTDLDYNSNTASTDLGINTNTASTDSSYYILTDIVSSQQTSINILKEILTVLKGDNGNNDGGDGLDIDINGSGRRSGGRGSRRTGNGPGIRAGGGKLGGLLKILGRAFAGVGAIALGAAAYDRFFNGSSNDNEKLNAESSSTPTPPPIPATSPAITPIPESQIFDRGEPAPEPLTQQTQNIRVNAGSNIPRGMTLNPVSTPAGIRLNAGVDTTSAVRLNQSIVPPIPSISLNSTNRVNQTRADLAGITAAQLMGRNQSPAQTIDNNTIRAFNNLPRPEYGLISPNVNNYNPEPTPMAIDPSLANGSRARLAGTVTAQHMSGRSPTAVIDSNIVKAFNGLPPIQPELISPNVNNYNHEPTPMAIDPSLANGSRARLAGTTAAGLLGRNQPPAQTIDSNIVNAFNSLPRTERLPAASTTSTAVPKTTPAASATSTTVPKTPVAASATSTAVPKTPLATPAAQPGDAARERRLQAVRDIGAQADAFTTGVNRMAAPLTNALNSGIQEKRGDTDEEDGVKKYKADEIVFKADKFDFGDNQDNNRSNMPSLPTSPAATPAPMPVVTGPRISRASAANEAAGRAMPTAPQAPAVSGQSTRSSGTQQRSDITPQIDPNNPGPLEPSDAGNRYARLFGMGMAAA
jgi:hypothetical protein